MTLTQTQLDAIFPPQARSDAFFDALYGAAEDGAYTIHLESVSASADALELQFALRRRPGKCLACQLTHGLPHVFRRHPIINAAGLARELAGLVGWNPDTTQWTIGETIQQSAALHLIPFTLRAC